MLQRLYICFDSHEQSQRLLSEEFLTGMCRWLHYITRDCFLSRSRAEVARWAHNPEAAGSNPAFATKVKSPFFLNLKTVPPLPLLFVSLEMCVGKDDPRGGRFFFCNF